MDPYLEDRWRSVFLGLSVVASAELQPRLPEGLRARLSVKEPREEEAAQERQFFIIDTADGNRVTTAIEILTPGHKAKGARNENYRRTLDVYAQLGINVVEIDLLRSPRTQLELTAEKLPPQASAAYFTCVRRASHPKGWEVFPMPLREPLPVVPIPCRATDPDVPLGLQPLIERVYADGGHDDIDYSRPPSPPLRDGDAAWAAELIRAADA